MPSLALPPVAPAMPVPAGAIVSAQDAAAIEGPQQSAGSGEGSSPFAAVLDRQLASTAEGAKLGPEPEDLTAGTDGTAGDLSAQPASDLAALLQGLLLPLTAAPVTQAAPPADMPEGSMIDPAQFGRALATSADDQMETEAVTWIGTQLRTADDVSGKWAGSIESAAISDTETGKAVPAEYAALPVPSGGSSEMQHLAHGPHHVREPGDSAREPMIVRTPVTSPAWHEDLGNKVSMLIGKELSSAELVLTPPSLGRVEVQISVTGDLTSAVFVAATPAARDALEQALPKLRDFLADAGINLSQATVGGESSRGGGQSDGKPQRHAGDGDGTLPAPGTTGMSAILRRVDGMVDTFA